MPLAPEQYVPHEPQLLLSVCVLTQALPHHVWPLGHWQTPLVYAVAAGGQQPADCRELLSVPSKQVVPVAQVLPQNPQLFGPKAVQAYA